MIDPVTLATAANYASFIGGTASVIGFFMERDENRRMLEKLDEIKKYIKKIDADIKIIKQQNEIILNKIDQLPIQIQAIVDEIIDTALLEERYSSLDRITKNYFLLPGGEDRYLINTDGWDELSDLLTYIFRNENRISTFFEAIKYCEFAIMVSDFQGTPIIANIIENKLLFIDDLREKLELSCKDKAQDLLNTLNSTNYILSHNFNDTFSSFEDFVWSPQPRKPETRTETYSVRVRTGRECDAGERGAVCFNTYENQTRTRTKPDQQGINFNKKRKEIIDSIPIKKQDLINELKNFKEVSDLIAMFTFYLKVIKDDYEHNKFSDKVILPMSNEEESETKSIFTPIRKDLNPYTL